MKSIPMNTVSYGQTTHHSPLATLASFAETMKKGNRTEKRTPLMMGDDERKVMTASGRPNPKK